MYDGLLTIRYLTENRIAAKIQAGFCKHETWTTENRIIFDQAKCETIYFI